MSNTHGALEGIRVLDLTRVLCGPYATMFMGDMGADIIKIENPNGGDDTRLWGSKTGGESFYFASFNRSKRSITIDLKSEKGKKLFYEMVKHADVVIENYRPGVTKRLGIDYDVLKEINPGIVFASASGFGSEGPYASRPGYDIVAQAMGGLMSITGPKGGLPCKVGASVGDVLTGLNLVIGILAALHNRSRTGKGQYVEVSLTNSVLSLVSTDITEYFVTGQDMRSIGDFNALNSPCGLFASSDGNFVIYCGNQKLFEIFCRDVLKRPELIVDERFKDSESRKKNEEAMKAIVEEWSTQHPARENVEVLTKYGVPASPVQTIDEIYHDEHIAGVQEMFPHVEHPVIGDMPVVACPIKFSDTKAVIRRPAPLLGADTVEILQEVLGMSAEEAQAYTAY
ncbi:MAG: CoA transferase [Oscillibacter sp.]|nr:CoA transferase [Oscillibacter sp.]